MKKQFDDHGLKLLKSSKSFNINVLERSIHDQKLHTKKRKRQKDKKKINIKNHIGLYTRV